MKIKCLYPIFPVVKLSFAHNLTERIWLCVFGTSPKLLCFTPQLIKPVKRYVKVRYNNH